MHQYKCEVVRVVDGDTVDVNIDLGFDQWIHNARVRLYGIDAAETRTKDPLEKAAGMYAKELLESMMPVGAEAVLTSEDFQRGKYGRIMGDFRVIEPMKHSVRIALLANNAAVNYVDDKEERAERQAENWKYLLDANLITV